MSSVNQVILLGRLGADPELKYTPSNVAVCSLRLATSERYKDKSGTQQEKTEWHRIKVWSNQGENCSKYLKKGSQIYVEGKISTSQYEGKNGETKYSTEIVAQKVIFLDSKSSGESKGSWGGAPPDDDVGF